MLSMVSSDISRHDILVKGQQVRDVNINYIMYMYKTLKSIIITHTHTHTHTHIYNDFLYVNLICIIDQFYLCLRQFLPFE